MVKVPHCTEEGVKTFTCANCGDQYTKRISALGHAWSDEVITVEPNCTKEGKLIHTCTICKATEFETPWVMTGTRVP